MTKVLSGAMSTKTVRAAISEYDFEIPKSIKAFQHQFLALKNNAPVTKSVKALPPLPLTEIDEKENDPDVLPLPSGNSDDGESDPQACPLPEVYIG